MSTELSTQFQGTVPVQKMVIGFVAGFLAVLFFHQPVLYVLTALGLAKATTYAMQATAPFGVPQVLSYSFWGGIWGILFALIESRIPRGVRYWFYAFLFGQSSRRWLRGLSLRPSRANPLQPDGSRPA